MSESRQQIGYLRSLDCMRGFASLGVLVFHAVNAVTDDTETAAVAFLKSLLLNVFCLGLPGMRIPLFFMISGFANHLKYAKSLAGGIRLHEDPRAFLKHRFRRLYPSYVVALSLSCSLLLISIVRGVPLMMVERYPGNRYLFLALDYLAHLTFLHGFFQYFDKGAGNGPLWTMSREVQFYLLYFPLLAVRSQFGVKGCVTVSILACFLAMGFAEFVEYDFPQLSYAVGRSGVAYWPLWVFGMLGVEMVFGLIRGRRLLENPIWFLIAGVVYSGDLLGTSSTPFAHLLLLAVTLLLLVMFLVGLELRGRWPEALTTRVLEKAGKYSYHLFLIHFPIVIGIGRQARLLGTTDSLAVFVLAVLVMISASIGAAIGLKKLMDRDPDTKMRKKFALA